MKLSKLAVGTCCNHPAIKVIVVESGPLGVEVRTITEEELRKVVDTYNAVAEAAEGANGLPYQMTFQLLKDEDVAQPVETV